jgi:hypothetical protein
MFQKKVVCCGARAVVWEAGGLYLVLPDDCISKQDAVPLCQIVRSVNVGQCNDLLRSSQLKFYNSFSSIRNTKQEDIHTVAECMELALRKNTAFFKARDET